MTSLRIGDVGQLIGHQIGYLQERKESYLKQSTHTNMQMIVEIEVTRISIVIGSFRATESPKIRRTKLLAR